MVALGPVARRIAAAAEQMYGPAWNGDRAAFTAEIVDELRRHPASAGSIAAAADGTTWRRFAPEDPLGLHADAIGSRLKIVTLFAEARPYMIGIPHTEDAWRGHRLLHFAEMSGRGLNPERASAAQIANQIMIEDLPIGSRVAAVANVHSDTAVLSPAVGETLASVDPDRWYGQGPEHVFAAAHELRHLSSGMARAGVDAARTVSWFQEGGAQLATLHAMTGLEDDLKVVHAIAPSFQDVAARIYPAEQARVKLVSAAAGMPLEDPQHLQAFTARFQTMHDVEHLEYLNHTAAGRFGIDPEASATLLGIGP